MKKKKFFYKKRVLITGNTGFKGSWLSLWMMTLGAKVLGIANGYPTKPSNFKDLNLSKNIDFKKIDVRNSKKIQKEILKFKPDFIFHLAAQAIVKKSYENPKQTWESNVIGTINILEGVKKLKKKKINIIIITSDKVYKNLEINRGYHEKDILGGEDPYSASKSAADLATQSYCKTILNNNPNIRISIARAGNVIGGGDWSVGRIIPDCMRSWSKSKKVDIRNPKSTRPWQHVFDVLNGYIMLAMNLSKNKNLNGQSFNFGPKIEKKRDVLNVVNEMKKIWVKGRYRIKKKDRFKETKLLHLNSRKAKIKLNWVCKFNLKEAIELTAIWYKNYYSNRKNIINFSVNQIKDFEKKT
tara:strand:+ start:384 stop:1448 length:1065 start_codon:yes stop_codon:yes gene_type:complete